MVIGVSLLYPGESTTFILSMEFLTPLHSSGKFRSLMMLWIHSRSTHISQPQCILPNIPLRWSALILTRSFVIMRAGMYRPTVQWFYLCPG